LAFGRGYQVGRAFVSLIPDHSSRSTVEIVGEKEPSNQMKTDSPSGRRESKDFTVTSETHVEKRIADKGRG
jgi:hypothetical protein